MSYGLEFKKNRKRALFRDRGKCTDCACKMKRMHVHHITPRAQGGSDALKNLITLCPTCHASRHDAHACSICAAIVHEKEANERAVCDNKGASVTVICPDCQTRINSRHGDQGCSLCDVKDLSDTRHKAGLSGDCSCDRLTEICDRCRKMLLFGRTFDRVEYFERRSSIDFRHWEGKDE